MICDITFYDQCIELLFEELPLAEDAGFSQGQALNWLAILALNMKQHNQVRFRYRNIGSTWLPSNYAFLFKIIKFGTLGFLGGVLGYFDIVWSMIGLVLYFWLQKANRLISLVIIIGLGVVWLRTQVVPIPNFPLAAEEPLQTLVNMGSSRIFFDIVWGFLLDMARNLAKYNFALLEFLTSSKGADK